MRYSYNKISKTYEKYSLITKDEKYPGTAVERMRNIHKRVKSLTYQQLNTSWDDVRRSILWAGGMRDVISVSHSFNDYNHCDLTAMTEEMIDNRNNGRVDGIAYSNYLGELIKLVSMPDVGPGGSWSTCMIGCASEPPQDVAHIQFKSKIAFKLVWIPPEFNTFVLLDDSGRFITSGKPTRKLPHIEERRKNYEIVKGSKYDIFRSK
jgi:hypothetical protein